MRDQITYGELVVLGTDGDIPGGNKGRRRSRFHVRISVFWRIYEKFFKIIVSIRKNNPLKISFWRMLFF
jgi:hypothetical protein